MKHVETISLPHDLGEFSEIIDVRSPSEYAEDHLPQAVNLPVLDNAERERVGTLYKTDPFGARKLGAELISRNVASHINGHLAGKSRDYSPLLYCWRGGMRSNSFAHILRQIGWRTRVLNGGYKAFRKYVTGQLDTCLAHPDLTLTVLSGQTGVAKTRLLHTLKDMGAQVLDLEGIANHKGSVLGLAPDASQPGQKKFETLLWENVRHFDPSKPIFTEAESNRIGKLHCPTALWKKLSQSRVIEINMPLATRATFLLDDYPHFTNDPGSLKSLLAKLTRLRGHQQIAAWHELIDAGQWQNFVESILSNHYDLVYRRAGEELSNYPAPSDTLQLNGFSDQQLADAATKLLEYA